MNIKNRLYLSAGLSIVLVAILFSVVLVTSDRIAEEDRKHQLLTNVSGDIAELDILTYEYLLHREKRMEQQWYLKFNSLREILEKGAAEEGLIPLYDDYVPLGNLFSQITTNDNRIQKLIREGASQERIDTAIGLEERLVAQLLIASQSIVTDVSRLAKEAHTEVAEAQRLAANLTLILMTILASAITTSSLLVARSISKPLSKLADYSRRVGEGEYTADIEIKGKDEVASVASDVKSMVGQLLATSEQLEKELTERKRVEKELEKHREHLEKLVEERTKELRESQEKLVRQEKLAVLGQLAGGVGHELRNPLGAIKNAAYFLNMALEQPEPEVKETLDILEKEVATSERIISSLLGFARPKPPIRRKVDINEVIQGALYHITVPENIKVVTQLDKSLPAILADPDQLGQAFSNIIVNGIQAMPEGGQLAVKSETSNQEWVAISFADAGAGIPKENLQKLFEPLFTTKAKGIGLGLAVTKTLIEGHGGTIKAQSEVGKGSTFTIRLPLSEGKEK